LKDYLKEKCFINRVLYLAISWILVISNFSTMAYSQVSDTTLQGFCQYKYGAAINVTLLKTVPAYKAIAAREYSSVTPENAMKFATIHPSQDSFYWADGDTLVSFAQQYGKRVHGHTLIWYQSLPTWVTSFVGDSAAWENLFMTHIQTVVGHYKGKCTSWDVVNEAINDSGGILRPSVWLQNLGPNYIKRAFIYAHQADSSALLFYNDYAQETNTTKFNAIKALVDTLLADGIPINGVGFQMHQSDSVNNNNIIAVIDSMLLRNVLIHISELDVAMNPENNLSKTYSATVASAEFSKYKFMARFVNTIPTSKFYGITNWDVTDRDSWIPSTYARPDWPLPFDSSYNKKSAYQGIEDGASNTWNFDSSSCQSLAGTYTDLGTNGTAITTDFAGSTMTYNNDHSSVQNIGFTFNYNGTNYTQFVLNTNGYIKLGAAAATGNFYYPGYNGSTGSAITSSDIDIIYPFNHQLTSGTSTPEFRVYTSGLVGNRICTIQFKNLSDNTTPVQFTNINFQIRLYEQTGVIEFVYGTWSATTNTATAITSACGIKGISSNEIVDVAKLSSVAWNATMTNSTSYAFTDVNYPSAGPQFNTRNSLLPPSGWTYRFTPKYTTWTGAISNVWTNASNWTRGIPTALLNAFIPVTTTQPTITGTQTVKNITISSGATLTNNGTFTISGSTIVDSGVIAGTGTTILNNTSTQTIIGTGKIAGLTINNNNGVIISSGTNSLNVSGVLTLQTGILTTNNNLVFTSDSTGNNGLLATVGALGNGGSINGNVTVQRYIPAKTARKYSYLGSPVSQTISNAWQQQIYITGAGTGGTPCGSSSGNGLLPTDKFNTNGFDVTQTNSPSMYTYNATLVNGSRYVSVPNTKSTSLVPGIGYVLNIRGNRNSSDVTCANQLETASPTAPEAVTLSVTGALTSGSVTVALNNPTVHPYTLLANPYPSPISYTAFQASNSNIYNKMWTYSPFANGNYTTYSAGVIANGASGYDNTSGDRIASGQAFFVQANASGNVVFNESHKVITAVPNTKYFGTSVDKLIRIGLKSTANSLLDEVVIRFNSNGNPNYDTVWDAISFSNGNQTLATLKGNTSLAIATYPDYSQSDTARLRIHSTTTGSFSLAFSDFEGLDSTVSINLKDKYLSIIQNIRTNPIYNFNITSDTNSIGSNRFEVVFLGNATTLPVSKITETVSLIRGIAQINWNTIVEKGIVGYEVDKSIDGTSFNKISRIIAPNASDSYHYTDSNLVTTNNYYRIKATSNDGSIQYSNVAKLTTHYSQLTTYSLFPNPVIGKAFNVQFTNAIAGKYVLSIYNVLGQKVNEQTISHNGVSDSYAFTLNNTMGSGVYDVAIREESSKKIVYQTSVLVQP
jgi:endo-1,4-beta-xylanase